MNGFKINDFELTEEAQPKPSRSLNIFQSNKLKSTLVNSHKLITKLQSNFDNPVLKLMSNRINITHSNLPKDVDLRNRFDIINKLNFKRFSIDATKQHLREDGLLSYNIPHTDNIGRSKSQLLSCYSKKMVNSLKISNSKVGSGNYNQIDDKKDLNFLCFGESLKLNDIKTKYETRNDLLRNSKARIVFNGTLDYGKKMGIRYNPFNFNDKYPNNFKRNITGGKFLN